MPMAAARCSRAVVLRPTPPEAASPLGAPGGSWCPARQGARVPRPTSGPRVTSGCTRFWPGLHGFAEIAGSMRRILTAPAKLGRGRPQPGRVTGAGGFPAPVMVAPTRGLSAPGTACGRGWRGTGLPPAVTSGQAVRVPAVVSPGRCRRL